MSSINTNTSAMNALSTLRNINKDLSTTQDRIATGLKVSSAKDNAAYFSISESMKGDSAMYNAIDEGLTLTKNSLAAAEKGATSFQALAQQFSSRMAFSQNGTKEVAAPTQGEFLELVKQMETIIAQSTFNGDDLVGASATVAKDATMKADANGTWTFKDAETRTFTAAQLKAADTAKREAVSTSTEDANGTWAALTANVAGGTLGDLTAAGEKEAALAAVNKNRAEADKYATFADLATAAVDATNAPISAAELADANKAVKEARGHAAYQTALNGKGKEVVTERTAVTGISRAGGSFVTTEINVNMVNLTELAAGFKALAENATAENLANGDFKEKALQAANALLNESISATTKLGQSGQSVANQQEFLKQLTDTLDNGVGAMVDADMEEEAARLQALQVQQQLATQSLSIANEGPQNLLSLFR